MDREARAKALAMKKKTFLKEMKRRAAAEKAAAMSDIAEEEIPINSPMATPPEITLPVDPTTQQCSLVDLNLLSGSSDRIRNSLGGYFVNEVNTHGILNVPPRFVPFNPAYNPHPDVEQIGSYVGDMMVQFGGNSLERGFGDDYRYAAARDTVLPTTDFIVRVEGDPSRSEHLKDVTTASKYWQVLFTGGRYLNHNIAPMFNTGAYDDHFTVISLPYEKIQENYLDNYTTATETIELSYDYNRYFPIYQNFVADLSSERDIPNYYTVYTMGDAYSTIASAKVADRELRAKKQIDDYNYQYYSFGGELTFKEMNALIVPPERIEQEGHITLSVPSWLIPSTKYIDEMIPSRYNSIEFGVRQRHNESCRNILFDADAAYELLDNDTSLSETQMAWPYYAKVSWRKYADNILFRNMIEKTNSDTILIRTIKEVFLGQAGETVPVTEMQFQKTSKYISGSVGKTKNVTTTTNRPVQYRTVDFLRMLLYAYDNVIMEHEDFQVAGLQSLNRMAATDTRALYRSLNSRNLSHLISDVIAQFGTSFASTSIYDIASLLNSQERSLPTSPSSAGTLKQNEYGFTPEVYQKMDFNSLTPQPKYNEVIAYRVQKQGPTLEDSSQLADIQNFWIFNSQLMDGYDLIDSQVKYQKDYHYKVFAYYLVKGYKYKYSNLQLSRIIGQVREDGYTGPVEVASGLDGGPPTAPLGYCVEYYNPYTNEYQDDFLRTNDYISKVDAETRDKISEKATDAQRIQVSAFSDDDGNALPPYVANFQVTMQPSLRLIEVPIMDKTFKILDHPPNSLDVVPGYTLNNDNMITFDINYENTSPKPYPRPITEDDVKNESDYLHANDILDRTKIHEGSASRQKRIEVFRLDNKPTSFRDFENEIPKTIDLSIDGMDFSYTTAVFNDIIKSNHKYYYLFRAVNDNNMSGHVDTIIEAELVNDGGYKYGIFDVLFEQDLLEEEFINPSKSFKNIFQLSPHLDQLKINTSAADFSKDARSQYDSVDIGGTNDDIWGKIFKIRLTSKKTGKKIDLNITYNDPDIKLKEDDED